jgi:hypothetical protein
LVCKETQRRKLTAPSPTSLPASRFLYMRRESLCTRFVRANMLLSEKARETCRRAGRSSVLQSSRVSTHLMSLLSNPSPSALRGATCARPVVSPPQNSTCLRQTATGACRRAVQVKSGGMQGARGVVARTRIINMQGRWVCCTRVLSCRCEAIELVLRLFACLV